MNPINIATRIGKIDLESCIYNASGPLCTTKKHLDDLGRSQAGAILTKSSTAQKREGNPEPRYYENGLGSINSMGLPNMGYEYYMNLAEEMGQYDKPYFMSVSGLSLDENLHILRALNQADGIASIELNLSCPNVPGKPQTGYDFDQMKRVLDAIMFFDKCQLGVKLPPYFDVVHFEQVAAILNQYDLAFVTCINSIGNGLVIDLETEQVVIRPKDGLGGIGGDYIKPTALANVRQFRRLLKKSIGVIGCGGVKTGTDIFEHILCGADAVQVGTQFMREGIGCFERLARELKAFMIEKGYTSLADFQGKLNVWV